MLRIPESVSDKSKILSIRIEGHAKCRIKSDESIYEVTLPPRSEKEKNRDGNGQSSDQDTDRPFNTTK